MILWLLKEQDDTRWYKLINAVILRVDIKILIMIISCWEIKLIKTDQIISQRESYSMRSNYCSVASNYHIQINRYSTIIE
jgi:PIN domain nuclease of toxin-antitoxin system